MSIPTANSKPGSVRTRRTARRQHPRVKAALALLRTAELEASCAGRPPALLRQGAREFNRRQFFQQHETLESLWRAEPGPVRYLYQGILQIGVGLLHLERGNHHGAVVKLQNGLDLLQAFEPACMGLDVGRLRREAGRCLEELRRLGPRRTSEFDQTLVPQVRWARRRAAGRV